MPLRKYSTHRLYRVFGGYRTKTVTLLKRNDDQQQGTVRSLLVFNARRGAIHKAGETLQGDMVVDHRTEWYLPVEELKRVGVAYLNNLDRVLEKTDDGGVPISPWRFWQVESTTTIDINLFENWVVLHCLRVDPTPTEG